MSFSTNIEKATLRNINYRKVLNTTPTQQLVLMSLNPKEYIHREIHPETTQFIRIEKGNGVAIVEYNEVVRKIILKEGISLTIPPNTYHTILNGEKEKLKLYTIYSPPEHKPDRIDKRMPKE